MNYELFSDRRELLLSTPDGVVHLVEPTADGGLALMRIGQADLPPEESVDGVFRLGDEPVAAGSPLMVLAGINDFQCLAGSPCVRWHHAYVVDAIAPVEDHPPPSLAVSAVRDGWDVLVCWPRELGPPSASSGWTLAGRAPAAVVEEPEATGSCVLLIRDLTTPPSFGPGQFHVHGTVPGVGGMDMAALFEGMQIEQDLQSFGSALERPGITLSLDPLS